MSFDDHNYHRDREQKCRELARAATDPDVRRRHEELAELHAGRAASTTPTPGPGAAAAAGLNAAA